MKNKILDVKAKIHQFVVICPECGSPTLIDYECDYSFEKFKCGSTVKCRYCKSELRVTEIKL